MICFERSPIGVNVAPSPGNYSISSCVLSNCWPINQGEDPWKIRDAKKDVTRIVTNPTRRRLSVGRMSAKSCRVYNSRARPLPCQNLRKVETWEDAETSAGKGTEADFMCVSSCAVTGRLASGGACKFSCVLSGVYHLEVRADLKCWFAPTCELCNVFRVLR